ncbi:MAG: hypothetical protein K2J51_08865 [Alistipes sp.]|nr:hypothetical protein [Alistipes sp.]
MKKIDKKLRGGEFSYLAPDIATVDITVERGFAQSLGDLYGEEGEAGKGGGIYDYDDEF